MRIFDWKESEMGALLASCPTDDAWPMIQRHFAAGSRLLEAGCGSGRWLRFLTDRGYDIVGLEYKRETLDMVRRAWPDLDLVQGDCERSPFEASSFDGALSFGVVEHWREGPDRPLADLWRVLKPGGRALITVPCLNGVRRLKRRVMWDEVTQAPKALAVRMLKRRPQPMSRLDRRHRFAVFPAWGEFYEYRMTPEQFRGEIEKAGFEVVEHLPAATFDGVYHELNPFGLVVRWEDWRFHPTRLALWLHERLRTQAFMHPHMQAIIARKPERAR